MITLYLSQQGCYICLEQETLIVKQKEDILQKVQLPLLEQVFIFGKSQITTQAIRACLSRDIPIVFLSRMGYCYGRIIPIERSYRSLSRYQQQLSITQRLSVARKIVQIKIRNSRTLLMRQSRRHSYNELAPTIRSLDYLSEKAQNIETIEQLLGIEGASAAQYFPALGNCLKHPDFPFLIRTRRPPTNPVNALLSFGYQVLWNHLLSIIELQGLDPYHACLHQGTERHAALASDLIEEFRVPLVDSLVVWLINSHIMDAVSDFEYSEGGCYLNHFGRTKYLKYWVQRMEETIATDSGKQPRWDLITQQIKKFKQFVYQPAQLYQPYSIR